MLVERVVWLDCELELEEGLTLELEKLSEDVAEAEDSN